MPEAADRPFTAASFYQFLDEDQLMGTRCAGCSALYLPPRAICPQCHGEDLAWAPLEGSGVLAAFTCVYVGPSAMAAEGYDRNNPYCTGIVELDEGVRISARILGVDARNPSAIRIGTPLQVEFVHRGDEGTSGTTVLAFRAAE
jgi:uncharacterized OB-fold protein